MEKLYDLLADWWPLLSPPEDYEEEAAFFERHLLAVGGAPAGTLLELGSGGGNNASHLKRTFKMTLADRAPGMVAVSRTLNPECEHIVGDLRSLRLGRQFDRVFIHDAICYMTTLDELRQAAETAFVHCRLGGGAMFAPDCVRETFQPSTEHGGNDSGGRGLRYLEWSHPAEPGADWHAVDYVYVMRERDGSVQVVHDRHIEGLFAREDWVRVLREAGFTDVRVIPLEHSEVEPGTVECFTGTRPA